MHMKERQETKKENREDMDAIRIRPARPTDLAAMEEICLDTAVEAARKLKPMREAFLMVFCDYYVQQEIRHCFVAVDAQDVPVGYILCAPSFDRWKKEICAGYLDHSKNVIAKSIVKGEVKAMEKFAASFPAHLHIDLLPSCQRMGLGTRLMDTLIAHLRDQGISGVMLGVGSDNEKGKNFYRKYGFAELTRDKQQIVMGFSCGTADGNQ